MMRKRTITLLTLLFAGILSACSSQPTEQASQSAPVESNAMPSNITFASSPQGTAFNSASMGVASVLSNESQMEVTLTPFAGMSAWIPMLDKGEVQLGLGSSADASYALHGQNGFRENKNVRTLVRGNFVESVGLTVRKDSDIQSVRDLKGKRVASDYTGGITGHITTEMQLKANGLTWDDVIRVPVTTAGAAVEALREGRVDAAFGMSPFTPAVVEAHNAVGLRPLNFFDDYAPSQFNDIPQDLIEIIETHQPGAKPVVLKAGFVEEETIIIEFPVIVVTSTHLSDEAAYELVATLWEHYEKLHPIYTWLERWNPEQMFDPHPPVPYHPGVVKFFKDQGLWTEEVEKRQQELLKLVQ
ncbi:TAXI family TRAP transporter solute-binding subunit [Ammoniphilus sp. CFH 90114]|uniref:TAXI family TRAP transporter solute-binding subunit n=1 Tax=Ammoniphilus sp. CFH 90114 TaxID=2493665 RepID=UPI00100DB932|nr:TAXI family TRAP transporter solute-binding subunit [Ammoniphilus sp. CFH 90114]RXT02837.1 TAXI family TRAP transporter solute-binding subunit [Ammoniphilus sp. CFH 90114]